MPNFFYTDATGNKQGPLTPQQLQALATRGTITPTTPLETDTGHKGVAGQIPGLQFNAAAPSPSAQPVQAPPLANVFCTNCGNPVAEQAVACMSCGMKPTGHKKFCRHCGVGINPEQVICVKCGASLAGTSSAGNSGIKKAFDISFGGDPVKKLNIYFMVYWIGMAAAIPTCLLSSIPASVFMFMLLYQLWKLIPADIARTTPGKAVGFCFIPFFNFYWIYTAWWGLAQDMNETLQQRGIPYQVNEGLGRWTCSLFVFQFVISICASMMSVVATVLQSEGLLIVAGLVNIPGYLMSLAGTIMLIFFFKSAKNGAIALLERRGA